MIDGTTRSSAMHGHELLVDGISKEFLLAPPTQKIGVSDNVFKPLVLRLMKIVGRLWSLE